MRSPGYILAGANADLNNAGCYGSANLRIRILVDGHFPEQANAFAAPPLFDSAGSDSQITHHLRLNVQQVIG